MKHETWFFHWIAQFSLPQMYWQHRSFLVNMKNLGKENIYRNPQCFQVDDGVICSVSQWKPWYAWKKIIIKWHFKPSFKWQNITFQNRIYNNHTRFNQQSTSPWMPFRKAVQKYAPLSPLVWFIASSLQRYAKETSLRDRGETVGSSQEEAIMAAFCCHLEQVYTLLPFDVSGRHFEQPKNCHYSIVKPTWNDVCPIQMLTEPCQATMKNKNCGQALPGCRFDSNLKTT